ncbi:MAG TPA: hypothetical protein PLH93_08050 [Flavobacteriales bacterium]|nr:hypothetical protein [Flavobacteriales bacterium]HQW87122.1 hypothetical protein [Flavobacteriales bacterium]
MRRALSATLLLGLSFALVYGLAMLVLCRVEVGGAALIHRTGDYFKLKGGNSYRKFREFRADSVYDVVFIGSSHAYRGYDPALFTARGWRAFNLGTSGQGPLNTYHIVRTHLTSANTRLLLLDVYEGAMVRDGLESTADLTQNMVDDRAATSMALALKDPRGVNLLALRFLTKDRGPYYEDSTYRSGGFSVRTDSVRKRIHYVHGRPLKLNADQLDHLERTLEHCADAGMPVVLVNHPCPWQSDRSTHVAFNAVLGELARRYKVPYLDFAYKHTLDDEDHFYDHNHLNQAGVERFNADLIPELEAMGLLRRPAQ